MVESVSSSISEFAAAKLHQKKHLAGCVYGDDGEVASSDDQKGFCQCMHAEDVDSAFVRELEDNHRHLDAFLVLRAAQRRGESLPDTEALKYYTWIIHQFYARLNQCEEHGLYKIGEAIGDLETQLLRYRNIESVEDGKSTETGLTGKGKKKKAPKESRTQKKKGWPKNTFAGPFLPEYAECDNALEVLRGKCYQAPSEVPVKWKLLTHNKTLKCWQQIHPNRKSWMTFRVEGLIATTLEKVVGVTWEVEHCVDWVPYYTKPFKMGMRNAQRVMYLSRLEHVCCLELDVPWPFKNRRMMIHTVMSSDLEREGRMNFILRSVDGMNHDVPFVPECEPPTNGVVPVGMMCCVSMMPMGKDLEQTGFVLVGDVHFGESIPDTLVQWFGGSFVSAAFGKFVAACIGSVDPKSKYAIARKNNREMYGYLEDELEAYRMHQKQLREAGMPHRRDIHNENYLPPALKK